MNKRSARNPKVLLDSMNQNAFLQKENTEAFFGFGVMGLTFNSGHILALRMFPSSSIGPGYISVWHRNPAGEWTFYQNVAPQFACPRYFGKTISKAMVRNIIINWVSDDSFQVTIEEDINLNWRISVTSTPATRFMNILSNMLPESLWQNKPFLKVMGGMAGKMLDAGHIGLSGMAPNGQSFIANPRQIWMINSSKATLNGEDLGAIAPLQEQARLADFWIPQRGIFAIGGASFEAYEPSMHNLVTDMQPAE